MKPASAFDLSLNSPFWKEEDVDNLLKSLQSLGDIEEVSSSDTNEGQPKQNGANDSSVASLSSLPQLNGCFSRFLLLSLFGNLSVNCVIACRNELIRMISLYRMFRDYPEERLMSLAIKNRLQPMPDLAIEIAAGVRLDKGGFSVPSEELLLIGRLSSIRSLLELFSKTLACTDPSALGVTIEDAIGKEMAVSLCQIEIFDWEGLSFVSPEKVLCQIGEEGVKKICESLAGGVAVASFRSNAAVGAMVSLVKDVIEDLAPHTPTEFFDPRGHRRITLEDCGKKRGVSRERARQIALKIVEKLMRPFCFRRFFLAVNGLLVFMSYKCAPATLDEVVALVGEEEAVDMAASLLLCQRHCNVSLGCWYDFDTELFLPCDKRFESELVKRLDDLVPEVMSEHEFQDVPNWAQKLLLSKGRRYRKGGLVWSKVGKNRSDYLLAFIHETFPTGYRIYDDRHWSILRSDWKSRFGAELPFSPSYVRGLVCSSWRNSDRGAYLPMETGSPLSEDALNAVYRFVESHLPLVYYKSIYMSLKELLVGEGFANENDFKSAFDAADTRYTHTAHYLKEKDWPLTGRETIYAYMMDNCPPYFTNDVVRIRFPFVANYTIDQIIDAHDGIVHLGNGFQLRVKDAAIPQDALDELRQFLMSFMEGRGITVCGSSLVFEALEEEDPVLLRRLKFAKSPQALQSIVAAFLGNVFVGSFDYISRVGSPYVGKDGAVQEYIDTCIGKPMRREAHELMLQRWGIGKATNFADLIEIAWSTHVEVRDGLMVPKSDKYFPPSWVRDFGIALDKVLSSHDRIDTKVFRAYYLFPQLNKGKLVDQYVLAGVTRSYFHESYIVKADRGGYASDFEIWRRNPNE